MSNPPPEGDFFGQIHPDFAVQRPTPTKIALFAQSDETLAYPNFPSIAKVEFACALSHEKKRVSPVGPVTERDGVHRDSRQYPTVIQSINNDPVTLLASKKIFVAGHNGMVGSAVVRQLTDLGAHKIVTRSRSELDLCDQQAVRSFFETEKPDVVVFAAAKVGGIYANKTYPAEFIYENLMMSANAIHAAYQSGVERFLFLGSTCIYPRMAPQPMVEDCLLTGPLEPTNEAYAIAKISGLKLCQHYRNQYGVMFHSAMPTNLYGPGDNYHPENSHVLPALIRRFHEAKINELPDVTVWGTGKPRREFLHVNDLARGIIHLLEIDDPPNLVNVGTGKDISIHELATKIANVVGYGGEITWDLSKPDGTPVKRTDISLIESTGWQPEIDLDVGLEQTYQDFLEDFGLVDKNSCDKMVNNEQ